MLRFLQQAGKTRLFTLAVIVLFSTKVAAMSALRLGSRHDGRSHRHGEFERHDFSQDSSVKRESMEIRQAAVSPGPLKPDTSSNMGAVSTYPGSSEPAPSLSVNSDNLLSTNFPTTVIQVPVATICAVDSLAVSVTLVASSTLGGGTIRLFSINTQSVTSVATPSLSSTPSTVHLNATALTPNASTTTSSTVLLPTHETKYAPGEASVVARESFNIGLKREALDTARIIQGNDGCQTVYSARTTALCSTTVRLAGVPAATISNCEQWVAFSTENVQPTECSGSHSDTTSTSMVYYAAPWYDLVNNSVPSTVRIQNCALDENERDCTTHLESWSVTTVTRIVTETALLSFTGPALIASGSSSSLTYLSISSTVTTATPMIIHSVVRQIIAFNSTNSTSVSSGKASTESTVTISSVLLTTTTWSLDSMATLTTISRVTLTTVVAGSTSVSVI